MKDDLGRHDDFSKKQFSNSNPVSRYNELQKYFDIPKKLPRNFGDVLYESKDRVATITLSRPDHFNAISETMPEDITAAFGHANNDDSVHVVVLTGAGRGFCGGFDLKAYAEKPGSNPAIQEMP